MYDCVWVKEQSRPKRSKSPTLNVSGICSAISFMSRTDPTTLHQATNINVLDGQLEIIHVLTRMHSTHSVACPDSVTPLGGWRNLNGIRRTEEGSIQISGFPARKQNTMSSCRKLSWNSGPCRSGEMCCCGSLVASSMKD